jgi:putative thioredoxin
MSESEYILEVNDSDFEYAVLARSRDIPVVVDFWAPWCAPCRTLGPLLERLADEGKGAFLLAKVNVDNNPSLSAQFGIRGIPAVKAFRDGHVVDQFTGALPEPKVREFVRGIAPSEADRALAEAHSLLATRHWIEAERSFRQALDEQPENGGAALGLIKCLLAQGRGNEAESRIDAFPGGNTEFVTADKLRPLASLLAEVESADPPVTDSDLDALYDNAGRLLARSQWEAGLDGLLETLRRDKKYRRGAARMAVLGMFELMGEDDPRTQEYRQELASVLF